VLADKMVAADPNNNLALVDVVTARSGLGDLLKQQKQTEAAVASYRKLVDAAERLNNDGARSFANLDIGIQAHHRLGVGLVDMGRVDEALEHFQKAANYLAASEKLTPGLARNLLRRAEIDVGRAEAFQHQKNWSEAIAAFSSAVAVYEGEHKTRPEGRDTAERAARAVCQASRLLRGGRRVERRDASSP
jgi:tetratricopeptide (TPR) repeat protein